MSVQKFKEIAKNLSENYFIDSTHLSIDQHPSIKAWNTHLMLLAYALKDNILVMGEPGFGKTTLSKLISAVGSSLPFDLYETAQLQGHPEQTKEELYARPDFGQLSQGKEKVIWQLGMYLPSVVIDEINRLPQGKQSALLNWMQTSRATYLNDTFYTGELPFFATANHPDDGNHVIIPPLADRFAVSTEIGYPGCYSMDDIETKISNFDKLADKNITQAVLDIVNKDGEKYSKIKQIKEQRDKFAKKLQGLNLLISEKELSDVVNLISKVGFSDEAITFTDQIKEELNYAGKRGPKRSSEAPDASDNHLVNIASNKTKNAASYRSIEALKTYSKAVALLSGSNEVQIAHVDAVAPYVFAHRLEFTEDFRAAPEVQGDRRGNEPWHLASSEPAWLVRKMMDGVRKNYKDIIKPYTDLLFDRYKGKDLTAAQQKKIEEMKQDAKIIDHPLIRSFLYAVENKS